jgi:hypothetical protein
MKKKSAHKTRLRRAEQNRGYSEKDLHVVAAPHAQQSPLEKVAAFFAHQAAHVLPEKKQKVMQRRGA